MSFYSYPKEMKNRVIELKETHTNTEMAEILSEEFGYPITDKKIKAYLSNHRIKRLTTKKIVYNKRRLLTDEQYEFVLNNHKGTGPKEMAQMLNEKYGTSFTTRQIKSYYHNRGLDSGLTGRFEKGLVPWNKGMKGNYPPTRYNPGQFKKGNMPLGHKDIGTVAKRHDGYWIKIEEPNVWEQYHRVLYKKHIGEIPENHNVVFKDGNIYNINLENLMLVNKQEHMQLNTKGYRSSNKEITEAGLRLVQIENLINKRSKNVRAGI